MKSIQLGVSLPEKKYKQLKDVATQEGKSMSRVAAEWIEQRLKEAEALSRKDQTSVTPKHTQGDSNAKSTF